MFENLFHRLHARKPVRRHPGRKTFRPEIQSLEDRCLLSTVNWIGSSGNFNVPGNWRDATTGANRVPGAGDDAVIPNAAIAVTISDTEAVNSLVMEPGPFQEHLILTQTGSLTVTNRAATVSHLKQLDLQNGASLSTSGNPTYLERGGSIAGTIAVATNDALAFSEGAFLVNSGARFIGIGTNAAGIIQVAGATVDLNIDLRIANFDLNGGNLIGSGNLTVSGAFTWSVQSAMYGSGHTTVLAGGSFAILGNGDKTLDNTRTLENDTGGTWTGSGNWNIYTGATFVNAGSFTVQNDQSVNNYLGAGGVIDNTGTWTKTSATAGATSVNVTFSNSGSVEVASGQLSFNYGRTGGTESGLFTADAGATLNFANGAFTFLEGTRLAGAGLIRFTGAALTIDAALSAVNLDLAGGYLTGPGDLTVSGAFTWSGQSAMYGSGHTTVLAGGSFAILGDGVKTLDGTRTLENDTGGTWTGSGDWNIYTGATFINAGSFTVQNDQSVNNYLGGAGTINNTGTWTKTSDLGLTTTFNVPFNNTGTVEVAGGVMRLNYGTNSGTNSGIISLDGGSFTIANGIYTLADGSVIQGANPLTVAGGTVNVTGDVTAVNFALRSGTLTGSGRLTVSGGTFDWTGGTIAGSVGNVTLAADATATIEGNDPKDLATTLNLFGTVNWTGGTIRLSNNAVLNLGDGQGNGTFNILSDNLSMTGAGTFRNLGLVTRQNLPGITQIASGIAFLNDDPGAVLNIASGILEIDSFTQNAGNTVIAAGARLQSANNTMTLQGGELSGLGTVMVNNGNGTLENVAGTISPGGDGVVGTLTIAGNYINDALGVVNLDISGSGTDQLLVTGTITLNGGTLNVAFLGDYTPTDGDRFTVLVSQRGVINGNPGDFNVYNANNLDASYRMSHQINGGSLTLSVSAVGAAPGIPGGHGGDGHPVADAFFQSLQRWDWDGGWIESD